MEMETLDQNTALMVDGNAAAGMLMDIFSAEMTAAPAQCSACGKTGPVGALLVYMHSPGIVMRCPRCQSIVLRIVRTPRYTFIDARGAAYLSIPVG